MGQIEMIRHIVVFKLTASQPDRLSETVKEMAERLEALENVVPGILSIKVFQDLGDLPSHWEVVLISDYESREALDNYQSHPRHKEVVEWINGVAENRAVIDYEMV